MKILISVFMVLPTITSAVPAGAQFGSRTGLETKFQYLGQSLEQLLNGGYEIRTVDQGQFILGKVDAASHIPSWVMCGLNVTEGMLETATQQKKTTSTCFALN